MKRQLALAMAALCSSNLILGWSLGYHAISAYIVFWTMSMLLAAAAYVVTSRIFKPAHRLDALIVTSVVAFAIIVVSGLVLGAAGAIRLGWYALIGAVAYGGSLLLLPHSTTRFGRASVSEPSSPWTMPAVGLGGAFLAFAVGFAVNHAPMTLYDSLSYHLFFSARWLQDHAISIIPTPFSDEAQAYAPGNGELFFLWLMLPFHGDLVARIGQLPFGLLAAATLYALGRRLGAPPRAAMYPPLFFLFSRPVFEQLIGADVDLVCASMFLAAIYFGLAAVEGNDRRDWILFGIALGLYFGTKYVALVYAPVFVLLILRRWPPRKALWALPGIAVLALPWYVRNWAIAGSPIYPASLGLAGVTLARGAFDRAAMVNTVFHTNNWRLLPAIMAHGFGPTLALFAAPFAVVGAVAMLCRAWWPHGLLAATPILMVPLYWFGFPVNIDSRFFMPAVAPTLLPLAFVFKFHSGPAKAGHYFRVSGGLARWTNEGSQGDSWNTSAGVEVGKDPRLERRSRIWNTVVDIVYAAGLIWILVGAKLVIPATLPWFMAGWLTLDGLLASPFLAWFAALALIIATTWWFAHKRTRWAASLMVCLCAASATALARGGEIWCRPDRCEYLQPSSPYIRANLIYAWRWIAENVTGGTVAYTGINLPYPLTGERLTNRVVYINTDGHPRWRFHDYDHAYRAGRFAPSPPLLAKSSGELMPVAERMGPRDDALRPRYERMSGFREAWVYNLQASGATHLFVAALSAYEIDYLWHDEGGFPIENLWASSDAMNFSLVYENPQVRIYAVARSRAAGT